MTSDSSSGRPRRGRRIAVLVETGWWGGLEMHTVDLVQTLARAGQQPFVACIGEQTRSLFQRHCGTGIPLVLLTPPQARTWRGWRRALRALDADAVLYQKGTLNTGSFALDLALRARFGSLTTVEHLEPPAVPEPGSRRHFAGLVPGLGLWRHLWRFKGWIRSIGPTRVVCVSDSVKRALVTDYGFPERRMVTVRNGINIERFRPAPQMGDRMRAAWSIPKSAHVFGSVRRFVRDKGLDILISAFARMPQTNAGPPSYLVIVGDGPEEQALKAQAGALGMADRVIFPGFTSSPWDVYPAFDTFIIPSRIEALGVVVLEAMASGCLVIGTRVGGIPEMIRDTSLGSLVPAEDADALAAAMQAARNMDASTRTRTLTHTRQYVEAEFSAQRQFLRIVALLEGQPADLALSEGVACT